MKMISCYRLYMNSLLEQLYQVIIQWFYSLEEFFCLDSEYEILMEDVAPFSSQI